ncbi:MAG: UvrD-helicase domain-containing protein [Candidatus Cloacimonetes bacterium]|nr:UvrD-helicase domain-containing protein [Candidatus Cloacimonadota bacterium]MCF7814293.1 UvrD-helicase domain-containing protein [Candidatus Cloacimonadota bacterium]MCF7868878.1 UvrD-helicase domain-containing protein [Candidatus Cloacimonadota bacterium]MCF7884334.1 UvrD-helicase domain-containing protein [Candidatus Cloacimonadota bacterium]
MLNNSEKMLLSALNTEQQKVVRHTEGPVLVLAGAGSGKTRSVIYRTAYLINQKKVSPWNILVVTFTNKAARELRDRLESTFEISTHSLWIGTFHSICTRILRYEENELPFTSNFSIYDDSDQKSIFKRIYKDLNIDPKKFNPRKVREIISRQKNSLILPKDFPEFNESNYFTDMVLKIYTRYQNFLTENNALDFDDLLMYTAILLHEKEDIRQKYQKKFRFVMIDEYQDTNYAQFKIVNLIAKVHQNLCVVGDDDQAIYSWRGADIRNILSFETDYKNVLKIKLEQNYRSPKSFLQAANCLIKNNSERHQKELWTALESQEKPELVKLENENREAEYTALQIDELRKKQISLNECVILYRTNAQSRVFENAFMQYKIRYQIVGGVNFYQRKEIKDILAYLRVLINPDDSESFLRIINFPSRGIGKVSIGKLLDKAVATDQNLFDTIAEKNFNYLSKRAAANLTKFVDQLESWKLLADSVPVSELAKKVIEELHLIELYDDSKDPKDIARVENIQEFIAATEEFSENYAEETGEEPRLDEYLQNISLQTDMDNLDEDEEAVKLMTMHNAKGLEFDHVFVVGLEDGLIPHSRSIYDLGNVEEERRLLYVAITRARKSLKLTYARTRRTYDAVQTTFPSRFLSEIDEDLLKQADYSFYEMQAPRYSSSKKPEQNVTLETEKYFKIGQKIYHDKFGKGVILNVDGKGNDAKLTISFSGGKLKKIVGTYIKTGIRK